ncbi:MAG: glutamate--tRNA ligase, partial [Turicibacter sp.]|nr:glutamate--tRNA ligase [Turicibacter sp.]
EEHITNTPKQMMVYRAFGWDIPTFAHMTLIVNENGKKLSKRDKDTVQFIEQYANMGYLPEALFNFIALLGWSPGIEEEILSHEQFIELFDEKRLSKSPSTFDKAKLAFINNRYIKALEAEEVLELCMPHLVEAGILEGRTHQWAIELVSLFHDRLSYGAEIVDLYDEFFSEELTLDEEAQAFIAQEGVNETLKAFKDQLEALEEFNAEGIQGAVKAAGKASGAKGKMLFMPCRIATTGQMHGPDLPKALALLGKDTVVSRIEKFI